MIPLNPTRYLPNAWASIELNVAAADAEIMRLHWLVQLRWMGLQAMPLDPSHKVQACTCGT